MRSTGGGYCIEISCDLALIALMSHEEVIVLGLHAIWL